MSASQIDLNQKIEIPGFSGTIRQLLKQVPRPNGKRTWGTVLPVQLIERLEAYCSRSGAKKSEIVRLALAQYLDGK
jgi:hypothetical protein